MNNLTISIYGNQIFTEIANELQLFSRFKVKFYNNLNSCIDNSKKNDQLIIFFLTKINRKDYEEVIKNKLPAIVISKPDDSQNILLGDFIERLNIPFKILNLEKKIIHLFAKLEFNKRSLISLNGYIIDKNERKIKKNDLELQLTEREINFLILFSKNKKPLNKNYFLKHVWHYSSESDTHTVETHIHRLRKKILKKFNDNNFIKNNDEGYYI